MSSKVCWQPAAFSALRIEEWDGAFIVFQPDSGKTHFLNEMGMQIILRLDQSPASADEICRFLAKQFQLPHDQNFSRQIIKTLHRFYELGLLEEAARESSI